MKKLLLFLIVSVAFSACKKGEKDSKVANADGDTIIFNLSETGVQSGESLASKFNASK